MLDFQVIEVGFFVVAVVFHLQPGVIYGFKMDMKVTRTISVSGITK